MNKWLFWCVFMCCSFAVAQEVELEFELQKPPLYPRSLYEAGASGWVLTHFNAHADGSISDLQVVDSSHPKFSRAVERALPAWRLTPWVATADKPAIIPVRHEYYFIHSREGRDAVAWLRSQIRHMSCARLNKALATYRANPAGLEQIDMHVFRHTFKVMARTATRHKLTDDQRNQLGERFAGAIAQTISRCEAQPELRYRDVLPKEVRAML